MSKDKSANNSSSESETDKMVVDEGRDNEVVSSNQPNPRPSSNGSASSGHGSDRGKDKSNNPQNMPDHTYSDAGGNESGNTSAASSPQASKNDNNSSSENDRGSPRPKKRQKTTNNGGDVSSSSENKRLSSPNGSKRHHRSNPSSSISANKKVKEKSANSSSDSEDDKMVVDESVDIEAVSSNRQTSPQSSTINSVTSANTAALKSSADSNTSLKVPPLRIVINSSGSNANQVQSTSGSTQSNSISDNSQKVSSSLSTAAANVSYAVSSSTLNAQEKDEDSGSDSEAAQQSSANSNSTSTTPGRVTRSSQRAALQQQEKGHGDTHRGKRARDGDSDSNKDFVEGQATSPTSSKDKDADTKEGRAKRKVRIKGGQPGGQTDKSGKHVSNEQDDDNDSTSSSTSSGAGGGNAASSGTVPTNGQQANKEFQMPSYNSYQMYLNIRKQVDKRRKQMFSVQPKAPQGFKDYLLNRGGYLLEGKINASSNTNGSKSSLPVQSTPPSSLKPGSALFILFEEQEKARQKLRIQHVIEKEKLRLSAEQEILRVHGRAALAMANQSVPFSVCTILKDDEIYNVIEPENDAESQNFQNASNSKNDYQKNTYHSNSNSADLSTLTGGPGMPGARSRYNGRLFLSWLQDVDDKWEKIKEETIMRQRRESESLMAIQKLDWEWKMKDIGLIDFKATPCIEKSFIPVVEVPFDFELLPS